MPRVPINNTGPGADPGFLEKGFICTKVWGSLYDFISFFLNIP